VEQDAEDLVQDVFTTFGAELARNRMEVRLHLAMCDLCSRLARQMEQCVLSASLRSRDDGASSWELYCGGVWV
jgi:hypothetical protein